MWSCQSLSCGAHGRRWERECLPRDGWRAPVGIHNVGHGCRLVERRDKNRDWKLDQEQGANRSRNGTRKGCKTVCVAPAAPASKLGNAGDHVDKLGVVVTVAALLWFELT